MAHVWGRWVALCLLCVVALTGCGGSDSPDPEQLPLVRGAHVAAHTTATGDDNTRYTALVIAGRSGQTISELNHAETRYLVDLGWHARRYRDGTANADAPDKKLWAFIGLYPKWCAGLGDKLDRTPETPHICASLGRIAE
jgi:hypothetical protein